LHTMKTKTYRIVFQDKQNNDHFEKSMQFFNLKDANEYTKRNQNKVSRLLL
jgi:hypothetical protein